VAIGSDSIPLHLISKSGSIKLISRMVDFCNIRLHMCTTDLTVKSVSIPRSPSGLPLTIGFMSIPEVSRL